MINMPNDRDILARS